jgi:hypothetical protein
VTEKLQAAVGIQIGYEIVINLTACFEDRSLTRNRVALYLNHPMERFAEVLYSTLQNLFC